jgi:hypothetical protein
MKTDQMLVQQTEKKIQKTAMPPETGKLAD